MLLITTRSERIGRWTKMLRSLARLSGSEPLIHTGSSADFITTMSGFRFSVHTGPSALALAAVVASHGSLLGSFDKRALSRLFDGKSVFITRVNKIIVGADSIICKMSNVDLTARSWDLTFKSHKRSLAGRDANEVYATLALASVMAEGPAGL